MKEVFVMKTHATTLTSINMALKHCPSGDARFGICSLVTTSVYPVCQSLKNQLRVGAGQTVIAEYVPNCSFRLGWGGVVSVAVRFLGVYCNSGQWIFRLSLFLSLALASFRLGVVMGLWGCGLAFGFRFRGCFGPRVTRDGEAGSLCLGAPAFGIWGGPT